MSEYIGLSDFLDRIRKVYGEDFDENSTMSDLGLDTYEFSDFIESEFNFSKVAISNLRNNVKNDMILYDIFNAFFV